MTLFKIKEIVFKFMIQFSPEMKSKSVIDPKNKSMDFMCSMASSKSFHPKNRIMNEPQRKIKSNPAGNI